MLYKNLSELEKYFDSNLRFFNYVIMKKSTALFLLREIYLSIPNKLQEKCKSMNEIESFSYLAKIDYFINQAKEFAGYIVINYEKNITLLDKLYLALVKDIANVENEM